MHEFYTTTGTKPQDRKLNQVWYKIIVDGVSTGSQWRLNNGIPARPHSSTELKEELTLYNPSLAEVKFALDPRFMVQASELTHRRESSIQFAVSDPLLAEHIIKGKVLNLFGKACKTRKYQERTPSTPQCRKCKALGHREDKCTARPRCTLCGEEHTEVQHTLQCGACRAYPQYADVDFDEDAIEKGIVGQCTHSLKCVNCSAKNLESLHSATSRQCPERIRAMGSARDVNRSSNQGDTNDQFQTVPKKKTKAKKSASTANPTTTAPAVPTGGTNSRYDALDSVNLTQPNTDEDHNMESQHV
ncbi:hypothetical protein F5878DRAFT_541137 [Lentinula raphanica]|uniref:Uncharacterized protein n=1 Tax=Lentinula raphanica TaxID=153919 RepID=A0AA38P589_9AGAR|nr:hypothetical protein F5878DRAFT_541137 [Lentinula raphanica]